jgi:hypothetical protein
LSMGELSAIGAVAGCGEQDRESVMIKVSEAVGQPADLLDDQIDGFGAAIGDSAGIEVGEHLLAPGLEGTTESGDLGNWIGGEAGDHLLSNPATLGGAAVVDGAELLVALPGQVNFPVRVAGLQTRVSLAC